jgi:hypothetical protein
MKYFKISMYACLALFTLVLVNSCKKVKTDAQLGDNGQQIIRIMEAGGTEGFGKSGRAFDLTLPIDSILVRLEYSASKVPANDVIVTLGVNDALRTAYNSANAGGVQYNAFAANQYLLRTSTVKIRAGQAVSEDFWVIIYPNRLSSALSYMLPLTITNISGAPGNVVKAPSSSTALYHIIGNALAGAYSNVALRYNYTGTVSFDGNPANIPAPASTTAIPASKTFYAIDPDYVWGDFSNLGSQTTFNFQYLIKQVGGFASIDVGYNTAFTSGNANIKTYVSGYVKPTPTQKARFRIITHYNNDPGGAGNDRIIDEYFTQL